MRPRTFAVVLVALLVGALGLRFLVVRFSLLPFSEEAVLKNAVAVTVNYFDKGNYKSFRISDPDQLGPLLAELRIKDDESSFYGWGHKDPVVGTPSTVVFEFANGMSRSHTLTGPRGLDEYSVDSSFCTKLQFMVFKHEGHHVDILAPGPPMATPTIVPDWSPDGKF